ncbi:MAG: hypothetical protein AAFN10_26105, partial [Bacteroidota bacterium]
IDYWFPERFGMIYVLLYSLPFPIDQLPFMDWLGVVTKAFWEPVVNFVGKNLLGLSELVDQQGGSGDTTYNYVHLLTLFGVSLIGTVIWSILDRKRTSYQELFYYFYAYLRYYLAVVLMLYGFVKIFKTQFPFPGLMRLSEPLGDFSPMGLLWTFMGYSEPYNWFTGFGEALGGFLLFFRRTTTLGSLVIIAVMSNVVVLNFSYDVPVKLFSLHLLGFAIILMLLDWRRLWNVLLMNKTSLAVDLPQAELNPNGQKAIRIIKFLLIGWIMFGNISDGMQNVKKWGDKRPKPDMYGLYEVETFVKNGDTLAPLITDSSRWHYLAIDRPNMVMLKTMTRKLSYLQMETDSVENLFRWNRYGDTTNVYNMRFSRNDSILLSLAGIYQEDTLAMTFKRIDPKEFLLVNRGFHWVNEFPFNR